MAKDPVTEAALQKRVAVLESEVKTLRFCVEHHTHVATSDLWTGAPKMSPQLEQITPPALDLGEVETIVRDVLDWLDGRGVCPHMPSTTMWRSTS